MANFNPWHGPTTCENLDYNKGAGFILDRLSAGPNTRKGVYAGTKYEGRAIKDGKFVNGYHSLLWSWLRNNGYIEVVVGNIYDTYRPAFGGVHVPCTAVGGKEPVYWITPRGCELLLEIIHRKEARTLKILVDRLP